MAGIIRKRMKVASVFLSLACTFVAVASETDYSDTVRAAHILRPVEVLGLKQMPGASSAEAVTTISGSQARRLGIDAIKGISDIAPNFFMPDYGSRMTSSIYVRGLGARIDQPVVGLNIDNIPYLNKDAYDFDITDIESIEVLRGAQAVLNGRNAMGGQINIRTLSPLTTQGLRFNIGASSAFSSGHGAKAALSYYTKIKPSLGMGISAQYKHNGGYFRNTHSGKLTAAENSGSIRWKTAWLPSKRISFTNTASLSLSYQDGYPYAPMETGVIAYNDTCSYRRTVFADGLTIAWAGKRVVVTSVTSVQYINDCMKLDQDFLPADYFTLTQSRQEWSITQDLFTRGNRGRYGWLGGVFAFYKHTSMQAPVTFFDTGIAQLIEKHRNEINPDYPIKWDSRRLFLGSRFTLPSGGFAIYHESTWKQGKWRFEAGLRLDIEKPSIDYNSICNTGYTTMQRQPDGSLIPYRHTPINIDDTDGLTQTFVQFLPKLTIAYDNESFTPYFNFAKGYKAGGYNTQMFSDVLQQRIMNIMGMTSQYTLAQIVAYRPEWSLNYEIGFHSKFLDSKLNIDGVLFFIDCRNQQLTVFPAGTTTGRIMTNAGRTRSFGVEITADYRPIQDLSFRASYGYTNATFRSYNDGHADYRGKKLPYAPGNTLFAEATWRASQLSFSGVTPQLEASVRCAGKIYWDESNSLSQPFYALPALGIAFNSTKWTLRLRCENITNTKYDTFYFMSMSNAFAQRGLPRRISASFRLIL